MHVSHTSIAKSNSAWLVHNFDFFFWRGANEKFFELWLKGVKWEDLHHEWALNEDCEDEALSDLNVDAESSDEDNL